MSVTLYGIPNCDTVKKARAWLDQRDIAYRFHDYKKVGIDAATLAKWSGSVGWEILLNKRGTTFRTLPDSAKAEIDRESALRLMQAHPSLIKRPVVEHDGGLLVGFDAAEWSRAFD